MAVLLEKMVDEDPPPEDEGGDEPITEEGAGGAPPRPDSDGGVLMDKLEAIQKQLDVLTAQRDGAVRAQPAAAA